MASARRCPMCHRANEARAWQCDCGYEFGQSVDKVLELLHGQRTNLRITLAIVSALDLAMVGLVIIGLMNGVVLFSGIGFVALSLWTFRTIRKLAVTRASIRQLSERALPEARLIKD